MKNVGAGVVRSAPNQSYSTTNVLAAVHSPILRHHLCPTRSALTNPSPSSMSYPQRTYQSYTSIDAFILTFKLISTHPQSLKLRPYANNYELSNNILAAMH